MIEVLTCYIPVCIRGRPILILIVVLIKTGAKTLVLVEE